MSSTAVKSGFAPLRKLYDWVMKWADHRYALRALALITFAEASFFLIPTDPLMMAMALKKPRNGFYYAMVTTLFSVCGAVFGYFIGMYAWQSMEPFFFEYIFSPEKFQLVQQKFSENVFMSIFVAGFSPIPFKVFTLAGGVAKVPLLPFVLASILSRGLRYSILGGLIYVFGKRIQYWIDNYFERLTIVVSAVLVLLVVLIKFIV